MLGAGSDLQRELERFKPRRVDAVRPTTKNVVRLFIPSHTRKPLYKAVTFQRYNVYSLNLWVMYLLILGKIVVKIMLLTGKMTHDITFHMNT